MDHRVGRTLLSMLAVLALSVLTAAPAFAAHKGGHAGGSASADSQDSGGQKDEGSKDNDGDADNDPETSYTEDDDTNDPAPNNVPDDGDNAHPSGKDRSVEDGKSGTQGNSESDPDDDGRGPDRTNGGPDKADGSGGVDKADQDGNNGCGNDDDFEDDNEGWCVRKLVEDGGDEVKSDGTVCDVDPGMPGTQPCDGGGSGSTIDVDVDCYTVSVTSTKDISHVEVALEDGSVVKFDGLSGYTWTKTFTQPVKWAKAKAGTTVVYGSAGSEDCDEDDDEVEGDDIKSDAVVTVDTDCYTVTVTSTKDISHVEVALEDGSVVKFDGLSGYTWTKTFTQPVKWAKAKSSTTVVYSFTDEECDDDDDDEVEGDDEDDDLCDADATMPGVQPCDDDDDVCDADATMPGVQPCDKGDDVCDADATMPGVQPCDDDDDEVEGDDDEVEGDGDFSTPGDGPGDGEVPPVVLGETLTGGPDAGGSGTVGPAGERGARTEALGATLPFTGTAVATFLIAAVALIGAGLSLLRTRKG
jgi:hypothetical protein